MDTIITCFAGKVDKHIVFLLLLLCLGMMSNCSSDSGSPAGVYKDKDITDTSTDSTKTDTTGEAGDNSVSDSDFVVFDATRFRQKPDMTQFGFTPIEVVYAVRLWEDWNEIDPWGLPSRNLVHEQAYRAQKINDQFAVIDIEHWPVQGDSLTVQKSLDNYNTVLSWFKEFEPDLKVGYWGKMPIKKRYMSSPPLPLYYQLWQNNNDRLTPLADKVDVFYPQLYTYSTDQEQWVTNAKYTIKEARRYNPDKPVYVFLWPQYYGIDYTSLDRTYIGKDFWELQLETARKYADGIVIWFPYSVKWKDASAAPWWDATKTFLEGLN